MSMQQSSKQQKDKTDNPLFLGIMRPYFSFTVDRLYQERKEKLLNSLLESSSNPTSLEKKIEEASHTFTTRFYQGVGLNVPLWVYLGVKIYEQSQHDDYTLLAASLGTWAVTSLGSMMYELARKFV